MMKFEKVWNGSPAGVFSAFLISVSAACNRMSDLIATLLWRGNLRGLGVKSVIQRNVTIRLPGRVTVGARSSIATRTSFTSEFSDANLVIGDGVIINSNVHIDFSGGLEVGNGVVISANVSLFTHSHGHDPHSAPRKTPLKIEDNVWIGANATICEGVARIAANSIIAAGAVLTREASESGIYGGVPARFISPVVARP